MSRPPYNLFPADTVKPMGCFITVQFAEITNETFQAFIIPMVSERIIELDVISEPEFVCIRTIKQYAIQIDEIKQYSVFSENVLSR